jgi:uncharacterized protein (TIGR02284 family)
MENINKNNEDVIETLNDLVQINNDRIVGYEKALEDTKGDSHYNTLFNQMISQSRGYKQKLVQQVRTIGGDADWNETTNSGKVHRVWMDLKAAFTSKSDKSALDSCEFGEDAAQKAYEAALTSDTPMPADVRALLVSQKSELRVSHDLIKKERDMQKAHA